MDNTQASLLNVGKLLEKEELARWFPRISRALVIEKVREVLASVRREIVEGSPAPEEAALIARIEDLCRRTERKRLKKILNGTGVVLHTNMGRSPLSQGIWRTAEEVNTGYSNIELDLESGKRGRRNSLVPDLLRALTGAEASVVVNNNTAALFLLLTALAKDKEVIVSRGEQVQIGGGFRLPDLVALSGARLVEVGTTNITTVRDYREAVTENTAMVLQVHISNFKMRGFVSRPSIGELSRVLPKDIILAVDQGSGVTTENVPNETKVRRFFDEGAGIVTFSGDKMLGGPQAGIAAGRGTLVKTLAAHPLMRVLRPGKTVYSLLEAALVEKLNEPGTGYAETVYSKTQEELRRFGRRVLKGIPKEAADLVSVKATTGGGTAPDEYFHSLAIELRGTRKPEEIAARLRDRPVPIIAILDEGTVRLNLSTLYNENAAVLREALNEVLDIPKTEAGGPDEEEPAPGNV